MFVSGDRVAYDYQTYIVHKEYDNGVVDVIPDHDPRQTIAVKAIDLQLIARPNATTQHG